MEKLLDLFSDYIEESKLLENVRGAGWVNESGRITKFHIIYLDDYEDEECDKYFCIEKITSKRFGFIKWLVENEKIEWEKVYENLKDYEVEIRIRAVKKLQLSSEKKSLWYLELLMLLSIQDEPLEFLVSILK